MNNQPSFPVITPRDTRSIKALFSDIRHCERLSSDDEKALCRLAFAGDISARNKLVSANLLFVVSIAKEFAYYNVPFEDVVSFGYSGLLHAAESFDPSKEVRFLSYAVHCIRTSIGKALVEYTRPVHVPANVLSGISRVRRTIDRFILEEGRYPSEAELSMRLSCDFDATFSSLSDDTLMLSVDAPLTEDSEETFEACMSSSDAADSSLMNESLKYDIDRSLIMLGERDALIVRELFGLDGESFTIEEVARRHNLSRERVRQILHDSVAVLRQNCKRLLYKYTA